MSDALSRAVHTVTTHSEQVALITSIQVVMWTADYVWIRGYY